jgi:hypothetical protein
MRKNGGVLQRISLLSVLSPRSRFRESVNVKALTDKGDGLTIRAPVLRPFHSLTLTREEASNTQTSEAAKATAPQQGRRFWSE